LLAALTLPGSVAAAPLTAVSLSLSPVSPVTVGTTVTLTATPTGGSDPQYAFAVYQVGDGWSVLQAYGASATCRWTPIAAGSYVLQVAVRESGSTVAYTAYAQLPFTVSGSALTAVSLSLNPVSPVTAGTAVNLTATPTGGIDPQYSFAVYLVGSGWSVLQAYGADATCTWTPTVAGSYVLQVVARESGSTVAYVAYAQLPFTVSGSTLTAVNLSTDPASPVPTGAAVTLAATPTGGSDPQYSFAVYLVGSGWSVLQAYGADTTCTWTPSAAGSYVLQVAARESGSTAAYAAYAQVPFTVTGVPLTGVNLSTNSVSPVQVNTAVTLTATPVGGTDPQYSFAVYLVGSGWSVLQAYGADATCTWTPSAAGSYVLQVVTRESGSTAAYAAYDQLPFTVTGVPLAGVNLSTNPIVPVQVNTAVTLTATAVGGTDPEFQFAVDNVDDGGWSLLQAYSTTATCPWTPTNTGPYVLQVTVRESGSTVAYTAYWQLSFTVTAPPITAVSLAASPASTVATGTAVTLTATPTGGTAPEYQFAVDNVNGSGWSLLQAYSTTATCTWTPTSAGPYVLQVTVRESGSTVVYAAYAQLGYTVTPSASVVLLASPASPVTAQSTVSLEAVASGVSSPVYQFAVYLPGSGWTVLQAYSTSATCTWSPSVPGSYVLQVTVNQQGSTVPYQAYAQLGFQVTAGSVVVVVSR
jgi:cell wall-associated protease